MNNHVAGENLLASAPVVDDLEEVVSVNDAVRAAAWAIDIAWARTIAGEDADIVVVLTAAGQIDEEGRSHEHGVLTREQLSSSNARAAVANALTDEHCRAITVEDEDDRRELRVHFPGHDSAALSDAEVVPIRIAQSGA